MGRLRGVPDDMTVTVCLPVGISAEKAPDAKKLPFEKRAWHNGWQK